MKLNIEKNLVEVWPESPGEKIDLEELWRILIDCNGAALKLAPVGEYVPQKQNKAVFYIEGLDPEKPTYTPIVVQEDCTVWCRTCNGLQQLKKGDPIPICCGKIMEVVE
ncbi:MAG: hypothetical protein LBT44_09705 [Clostridiales bacterium]|jgi:hypothetical protein|nr:hypothetical protein [Clostridiales bacterium]